MARVSEAVIEARHLELEEELGEKVYTVPEAADRLDQTTGPIYSNPDLYGVIGAEDSRFVPESAIERVLRERRPDPRVIHGTEYGGEGIGLVGVERYLCDQCDRYWRDVENFYTHRCA